MAALQFDFEDWSTANPACPVCGRHLSGSLNSSGTIQLPLNDTACRFCGNTQTQDSLSIRVSA